MEAQQEQSFIDRIISLIEKDILECERGDFLRELKSRIKARLAEKEHKLQEDLAEIQNCISKVDNEKSVKSPSYSPH